MLYTKKGDAGKTNVFGCDQKISKSSAITEALGCLDEINSYLGVIKCKVKSLSAQAGYKVVGNEPQKIINRIQNDLFIIQAQVAGADKKIKKDEVKYIEEIIFDIEKELPEIKSFLISGTNEISANFDFARALARRAERRVVAVGDEGKVEINSQTLVFMNRLSSLLYAFARQTAIESDKEESPKY